MKLPIMALLLTLAMADSLACCAVQPAKPALPQTAAPPATQNSPAASHVAPTASSQGLSLEIDEPADESVVKTGTISISGSVIPAEAEITVNGISVSVETGNFTTMIELEQGPNSIDIQATDSNGRKSAKMITVMYIP